MHQLVPLLTFVWVCSLLQLNMSLLQSLMASGKTGGYPAPPTSVLDAFGHVSQSDGSDIFRLMSKANKYSQASNPRKKKKADRYGYMAGQLMNQCGVQSPEFDHYHQVR